MKGVELSAEQITLPEDEQHRKALLPWVSRGGKRLWAQEPAYPVTDAARLQISALLFRRLTELAKPTLDALLEDELRARNPVLQLDIRLATREERAAASQRLYRRLLAEDLQPLFQRSPLLKGFLHRRTEQFAAMILELLGAISENREEIRRELMGEDPGAITGVQCDAADSHFHGRCTLVVVTERGRFLYKPHDCRCDVIFGKLVERWFSDITRVPRCLARGGYGLCEFVAGSPAQTLKDAACFFENMGGLCALFQALGSTDLHVENFLAVGAYPVLVDLETVLTPVPGTFHDPALFAETQPPESSFMDDLNHSLYASALLPKMIGKVQYSVLFSTGDNARAVPVVNGVKQTVRGYETEFFTGFSAVYDRCIQLRAQLLQALDAFRDLPVRRLIRQTDDYYNRLQKLLSPPLLQSEETQRAFLSRRGEYFLRRGAPQLRPIAEWEAQCLLEGDIPYFCALGGGRALLGYEEQPVVQDFFSDSAVDNARIRLNRMNETEKEFEITVLKRSFASALELAPENRKTAWKGSPEEVAPLSDKDAVKEAEALFSRIREKSVTSPSGKTSWLDHTGEGDTFSPMRPCLFRGTAGVGLFFAAIAAVSEREDIVRQARRLCKVCLEQLEDVYTQLKPAANIPGGPFPLGLASGVGGVLRSLTLIGRYLNDQTAVQLVQGLMGLLREEQILSAEETDLISGSAGLLAAVSGAGELRETERGRQVIRWCAQQLLANRTQPDGDRAPLWNTLKLGRPISGMGHGMAGIGHALLRAGSVLHEEKYRGAGMDAMRFESRAFREKLGTWPDMRPSAQSSSTMHGFCSGAPGIGLAMLDAMEQSPENASSLFAGNLARARSACDRRPLMARDHLCCGNSAVVDFYLEDARRTHNSESRERARAVLTRMTARKRALGDYTYLPPTCCPVFSSTLFYGGAGVGYELLRLAYPGRILSVLL